MRIDRTLTKDYVDFIDEPRFAALIAAGPVDPAAVRDVIAKSLAKSPLTPEETAVLLRAEDQELVEEIFAAARRLKRDVYGHRIVLFAPLYVGSRCVNECRYCAFRADNPEAVRRTLDPDEVAAQVRALENQGHKRLILVFGEHPRYDADFIADTVRRVYAVRSGRGEIRRVNVNAAPLDHAGFAAVHAAGIGTYQVFQETYHRATYAHYHPAHTFKGDYDFRLDSLNRAFEAGCDDMGIGALFGLADWRFDVLGLVAHARHLQARYGVGPIMQAEHSPTCRPVTVMPAAAANSLICWM
jgi:2-iminoacetate synthase